MATDVRHPTELLPSYALDALEDAERAGVETHLAGCAACRAEVARLTAAADALAESVAPVTPPPDARRRLMARIAADRAATEAVTRGVTAVTDPITGAPRAPGASLHGGRAGTWIAAAASAGAIALAAFSSWQAAGAQRELAVAQAAVARLSAQLDEQTSALAEISAAGQPGAAAPRVSALQGSGSASTAAGRLVYQPAGRSGIALLERLPALEPGRIYQLWLLRGTTPTPAGTFVVDGAGRASAVLRAPERLDSYTGIGLTAEPAPGSPAPTGPILASGSLSAP